MRHGYLYRVVAEVNESLHILRETHQEVTKGACINCCYAMQYEVKCSHVGQQETWSIVATHALWFACGPLPSSPPYC